MAHFLSSPQSSTLDDLTRPDSPLELYVQNRAEVHRKVDHYQPENKDDDTANLLKMCFKYLADDGRSNLAEDVLHCKSDKELQQLAESIDTGLLRPMMAKGAQTPVIPSPRFGVEDSIDNLLAMGHDPVFRNDQAKLRTDCLRRDGNMCVVSKAYNVGAATKPPGVKTSRLTAAHIVPFSLGTFKDDTEERRPTEIWVNIFRYFPSVRSRINFSSEQVNSVKNVMMLANPLHDEFGDFRLAFESTDVPNRYRVETFASFSTGFDYLLPPDRIVTFGIHDGPGPLPSKILLETHCAIARVLNATGRAELVEQIRREWDESGAAGLAPDGSINVERLLSITELSIRASPRNAAAQGRHGHARQQSQDDIQKPHLRSAAAQNPPPSSKENRAL